MFNNGLLGNKKQVSKFNHLTILYANFIGVRLTRFLLIVVVLQKALILCAVMVLDISLITSQARFKYFVIFIDGFNWYTWVYFL